MNTLQLISAGADIISAATALLAVGLGVYGFTTWRREKVGGHRIDLAAEALPLIDRLIGQINLARYDRVVEREILDRPGRGDELPDLREARDKALAFLLRFDRNPELQRNFFEHELRMKFLFHGEIDEPYNEIGSVLREIKGCAIRLKHADPKSSVPPDLADKWKALLTRTSGTDAVAEQLDIARREIEKRLMRELT